MQEDAYRIYVTDSLRLAGENKYLAIRFDEMIHPKPVDTRTSKEIIDSIKAKLKG